MAEESATEEAPVKAGSGKKMIDTRTRGSAASWEEAWRCRMVFYGWRNKKKEKNMQRRMIMERKMQKNPDQSWSWNPFSSIWRTEMRLRFLKVSIKLELDRPEEKTDFPNTKVPAIRDALLVLLSSKESQLLRTVNGKRRIREEIMTRVNGSHEQGEDLRSVFFTDFIIQ